MKKYTINNMDVSSVVSSINNGISFVINLILGIIFTYISILVKNRVKKVRVSRLKRNSDAPQKIGTILIVSVILLIMSIAVS